MPLEVKLQMETLYSTFLADLRKQEEEERALAEQVKRAQTAAAVARAAQESVTSNGDERSPAPSRLPTRPAAPAALGESNSHKRPLASQFSTEPTKRLRISSGDVDEFEDYQEDAPTSRPPSAEDVKPNLSRLVDIKPILPRRSPAASPLPTSEAPPDAVIVRYRRLPSYVTPSILQRWLEYGPEVFAKAAAPNALNLMAKGFFKIMPRNPPPRPLSVRLVQEGPSAPEAGAEEGREALVGYRSQDHAWEAKQLFDATRILPRCTDDELVEVTLM